MKSADLPEEELGELIAELPPVPASWVERALAIGGAQPAPEPEAPATAAEPASRAEPGSE